MQLAKLIDNHLQNEWNKPTKLPKNDNCSQPKCNIQRVGLSLFSFSLQGVGKDILIDKFWLVRLAFLSELAMCMAFSVGSVSYTHLRAHETVLDLVCRLL